MKLVFAISHGDGTGSFELDIRAKELAKGMDLIVYPESGLHPSTIAQLTESYFKYGKDAVICTHSELLILRGMRMVREGKIKPHQIELWQWTGIVWSQIKLDDNGDLASRVLGGFFENSFNER